MTHRLEPKSRRLVSFDGTEECATELARPDRYRTLFALVTGDQPVAFRGSGLSYCLASSGDGVRTISMRDFDRILGFDEEHRTVSVEAGLTVGELLDFAVVQGCYFPVLPGHPSITVGGCAGFNVHGKTQHNVGHFADHVASLTLFHPEHGELRCSEHERPDLFHLTLGGMGLTGCIVELTLRLQPLAGTAVRRHAHQVAGLDEALALMHDRAATADALYSWHDFDTLGKGFGRGVVYEERFEPGAVASRTRFRTLDPGTRGRFRAAVWNPLTTRAVNTLYPRRDALRREVVRSVHDSAFPINGNEAYFRLFGATGLREYQLVVPHAAWPAAATQFRRLLARFPHVPVTLGSLKLFAGAPRHLWFVDDGVCLTLDTPARPEALALFGELDRLAVDHGARVNLAKDSRVGPATVRAVYPGFDGFADALAAFDPKRRFDTALRRRLDL